jgi:hypothetical protein
MGCNGDKPGAVVVHLKHALVAYGAVVGSVRLNHEAVVADPVGAGVGATLHRQIAVTHVLLHKTSLILFVGLL